MIEEPTTWGVIEQHTELFVAFGGIAAKNSAVNSGGLSRHVVQQHLRNARRRGTRFISVSPLRDDIAADLDAEWLPIVPGTDTALMLALCFQLMDVGGADVAFLSSHTVGHQRFLDYLQGRPDGIRKDAAWAARSVASRPRGSWPWPRDGRCPDDGERELVAAARTLRRAAAVGRHRPGRLPRSMGLARWRFRSRILGFWGNRGSPQPGRLPHPAAGTQPDRLVHPGRPVADMLLNPGQPYEYNGEHRTYPGIRLVYWAGGNPFHHHQDLTRLTRAFTRPDTVVVHDPFWTATAAHADIVLPTTTTAEREDLGTTKTDTRMLAMHRLLDPVGESRDDYLIFSELAKRLGFEPDFTEGRDTRAWLAHLYENWRPDPSVPDFETFWREGEIALEGRQEEHVFQAGFRADPVAHPLKTPSGRIELFSSTIAGFGYDDCPGHPTWLGPPSPPTPEHPLHLVANNPADKLHSQLDHGRHSAASKIHGRQPLRMHPDDAAARLLKPGQVVVVRSRTGSALAGLVIDDGVRAGVVQMSTGAWFDPVAGAEAGVTCGHGNVNALTGDVGTSRLAQGCTGQLGCVQVEAFEGVLPPVRAHDGP